MVTGTIHHRNPQVLSLWVGASVVPIHATGTHEFYSHSRDAWVHASDLAVGELLEGKDGPIGLRAKRAFPGVHEVFNLEIEERHEYRVGTDQVRVHNTDCGEKAAGGAGKLPRFQGPKPTYHVNEAHVRGPKLNPNKEVLPADAAEVYKTAVPDAPEEAQNWFGKNADGTIYRFSNANNGTAHFSGSSATKDGIRNITPYARKRLEGK